MTPSQAKALKVGDLLRYKSTLNDIETLEIVTAEWQGSDDDGEAIVQTVAIIKQTGKVNKHIGEKGFVQWNNFENFEKVK
jgi:uncharacterized protein YchJ